MKAADVPAEWVALMVAASMEYQARRLGLSGNLWATYKTEEGDRIATEAMRAALAAVAPLIAAAERERCAALVEDAIYTSGGEQPFLRSRAASPSQRQIRDLHHDTLAAAIRALGDADG